MSMEQLVDQATFGQLQEMMGAEFLAELIDTYCQETPQLIETLEQALARNDAPAFQRTAHSIKSSSASLGALPLSDLARELEMAGKAGQLSGAEARVQQLAADYRGVEQWFRAWQHGA